MPNAITHFLIPVILLELFRYFFIKNKKSFPIHYIFIGGIAGLFPDLDIALYYFLSFFGFTIQEVHRTFSHNLFVPLVFVFLGLFFWKFKNKELGKHHLKLKNIFLVIAFGIAVHLLLDTIVQGSIIPLYPLFNFTVGFSLVKFFPSSWQNTIISVLDAGLLILWMISLEVRHKISDFI